MTASTTLQRLLKYPHSAVFDKAPGTQLALRVRNPHGLTWVVADGKLIVTTGSSLTFDGSETFGGLYDWGPTTREYDLMGQSLGQLANALRADGNDVVFEDEVLSIRAARILVEGGGDQDVSNGDHLNVYTSVLWALLSSYASELNLAEYQVGQALRQMILTQAEADWLDVWASIYGVPRLSGESDGALQTRIPEEVFRHRVNGFAIEEAIRDATGFDVAIDEPWKRMFLLDSSRLSDVDHLQDGRYYTYHVIQPVGEEGTRWADVYPHVVRNKAAGIEIYAPRIDFDTRHIILQPPVEYRVDRGHVELRGYGSWAPNNQILGILRLDDEPATPNHPVARHDWTVMSSADGLNTNQQIQPARNIAMASIALSEGPAAGDENFIFSRGAERFEFDPEPVLSDELGLSAVGVERVVELVEVVSTSERGALVEVEFEAAASGTRTHGMSFDSPPAYAIQTWQSSLYPLYYDGTAYYDGALSYNGSTEASPGPVRGWDASTWAPEWRRAGVAITNTPL